MSDIADAVERLLDVAVATHEDVKSGEHLTECRMCGTWEGHTDACPVPALERWQEAK